MKRFKKFAHKQFQALKAHLQAYDGNPDPEVVHEIRVDIKKIKAVLQVIASCRPKNSRPINSSFLSAPYSGMPTPCGNRMCLTPCSPTIRAKK